MAAKINATELQSETLEKILPEVVAKPVTIGMSTGERNRTMHDYYEKNKEAIIIWYRAMGASEMMKAWGIAYGVWGTAKVAGLRNRWLPEEFPVQEGKKTKVKNKQLPPAVVKTPPCDGDKEVCKNCSVLLQYGAYQQAIHDVFGVRR